MTYNSYLEGDFSPVHLSIGYELLFPALFCVVVKVREWVNNINSFSDISPIRRNELLIHTKMSMHLIKHHTKYKESVTQNNI